MAGGTLIWAAALFTTGALGILGTWALAVAAVGFTLAAVVLVTALDEGPVRPGAEEEVAALRR